MTVSIFELFKIGIGPSSSHTMGPMTASGQFIAWLAQGGLLPRTHRIQVDLYGSLALTGKGHGTDQAVILGLSGFSPETLDPDHAAVTVAAVRNSGAMDLDGDHRIDFNEPTDLLYHQRDRLPFHSNGMRLSAFAEDGTELAARVYYSIGGGAVLDEQQVADNAPPGPVEDIPFPFGSGAELLDMAQRAGLSLAELARANEVARRPDEDVREKLATIAETMNQCIERGIRNEGILPGGLKVKRRAAAIQAALFSRQETILRDPLAMLDWINLWALSVNEENAAGGRVVTAPTNGAAGIIPAVLRYYQRFIAGANQQGTEDFLLVASLIGSLFKENASISGAEVGCQGEVGVACSMAAAGLAFVLGGTSNQIENAAEIAMEHNLGLTCDPIGGLVQVPCIERNAVGAVKAIEAARIAMLGDGTHRVSLDQVIETMLRTGAHMDTRYKETSLGGLAVNVVEC